MKTPVDGARISSRLRIALPSDPGLYPHAQGRGLRRAHRHAGDGGGRRHHQVHGLGQRLRQFRARSTTATAMPPAMAICRASRPACSEGAHVRQGQVFAYSGMTGMATGPHLHYEIRVNGTQVNPLTVKMAQGRILTGSDCACSRKSGWRSTTWSPSRRWRPRWPTTPPTCGRRKRSRNFQRLLADIVFPAQGTHYASSQAGYDIAFAFKDGNAHAAAGASAPGAGTPAGKRRKASSSIPPFPFAPIPMTSAISAPGWSRRRAC